MDPYVPGCLIGAEALHDHGGRLRYDAYAGRDDPHCDHNKYDK